ncbi:hypothetical protein ACWDKQ_18950 [Saccharopolyspora sp. NPDC000995]
MLWFATTGLLNGVVYTIFPTTVAGYLGAKNPGVLRRNAIIMPFYQVFVVRSDPFGFGRGVRGSWA